MVSADSQRPLVLDSNFALLATRVAELQQPAFRTAQLWQWLHTHGVCDPQQMTNLPVDLRAALAEQYDWAPLRLLAQHNSGDRATKLVLRTRQGNPVEAVMMPGGAGGASVCLSSHSGCSLGCRFCQTGYLGQLETLSAGQILAQLYLAEQATGKRADRVVLMGMGEPLLNLGAVRHVVDVLCDERARAWAPRRITLSTVGLLKPIMQVADTFPRINLALSLHFTTAEQRQRYMPKAEADLERLAAALAAYRIRNGGKVTVEYMLLARLNDSEADVKRLVQFARRITDGEDAQTNTGHAPLLVNLLTYNPITSAPEFVAAPEAQLNQFARWLSDAGIAVTVRRSRGQDIAAACGQLGTVHTK
jgi:23S rRNA (adenine2503-C2)-methyltransferase